MADEFSIFGQVRQMNPAGRARDSKEVPVDREARRRAREKKRPAQETAEEDRDLEEREEGPDQENPAGTVVDIVV